MSYAPKSTGNKKKVYFSYEQVEYLLNLVPPTRLKYTDPKELMVIEMYKSELRERIIQLGEQ